MCGWLNYARGGAARLADAAWGFQALDDLDLDIRRLVDAHQAAGWPDKLVFSSGIVAIAIIVWAVLWLAEPIGKRLGTGGLNIVTRIMGLILAAMAVQFIADGLLVLFPGLSH